MGLGSELVKLLPFIDTESELLGLIVVLAIVIIGLLAFNFGVQLTGGRHGLTADVEAGVSLMGRDGFAPSTLTSPDVARYYQQKQGSKVITPTNISKSLAPTQVGFEGFMSYQQPTATSTKSGTGLFSDVVAPGISSMGGARASVMARNATEKIYAHTPAILDPSADLY